MSELALAINDPALHFGTILKKSNNLFLVNTNYGAFEAIRASSCLLEPELNDYVLFVLSTDKCYILNVLERDIAASANILLPAKANISLDKSELSNNNALNIEAGNIRLKATENFDLQAKSLSLTSSIFNCYSHIMNLSGKKLMQSFSSCKNTFKTTWQSAKSCFTLYKDKSEVVENKYNIKTLDLKIKADNKFNLRSDRADLKSETAFNIDGKNINIG